MHVRMDVFMMDGWMDGCVKNNVTIETVKLLQDGWMDGWADEWIDVYLCVYVYVSVMGMCTCMYMCVCVYV